MIDLSFISFQNPSLVSVIIFNADFKLSKETLLRIAKLCPPKTLILVVLFSFRKLVKEISRDISDFKPSVLFYALRISPSTIELAFGTLRVRAPSRE